MGDLARCEQNYQQAQTAYEESISLLRKIDAVRDLASALHNLGHACLHLGDIEQAERDFRDALEKDPDFPIAYFNLAIIAYVRDETVRGDNLISVAAEKGYSGGSIDALISRVGEAYARLQARA